MTVASLSVAPRTIAIIPARGGSKRIPRKNIYPFDGVPMLAHAIRLARTTGRFDEVLVSTDCPDIAKIAQRFGASVPFMRSECTANDQAPTFDVIHEVLERLECMGRTWRIGVCIYPTAVLAQPADVTQAIDRIARGDALSVMPVTQFDYPIWRALTVGADGAPVYAFPAHSGARSQDLPPAYHDAGQWYAFDIAAFRPLRRFMGECTRVVMLPSKDVQDIDTLADLRLAELKYRARFEDSTTQRARHRPWVMIRADATPLTGSGHVMRCLALAEAFAARGHDVVFASRSCVPELRSVIEARGFESVLLEMPCADAVCEQRADAAAMLQWMNQQSKRPAWIVVDHYGLDATWEISVRSCGAPLLALDDLADRPHACDALLDQNMIEAHHSRYVALVPEGARLLLGGRYALLRAEFAQACERRDALLQEGAVRDVVLFMGATDAANVTQAIAMRLRVEVEATQLVVVVGHINPHREVIKAWCRSEGVRCEVGVEDVSVLLQTCRLLVGSCGMTAVEAQALGIPCLLVPLSPIQHAVAQWFTAHQRAVLLELDRCGDARAVSAALNLALDLEPDAPGDRPISVYGASHAVDVLMEFAYE
jgi:pseudaminic acid cytidylyltransferase